MVSLCFILVFLNGGLLFSKADRPSLSVILSDDFVFVGRSVEVTLKTTVKEPMPLRYKIKMGFNETAYLRILNLNIKMNESLQITGNKVPNLTSTSGNEKIKDEATFDFGQVTPNGVVDILVNFRAQLLAHPKLINGEKHWISLGVEFTNGSIWANQLSVTGFKNIDPEPVLISSVQVPQLENADVVVGPVVDINLQLTHDPIRTTSAASSINVTVFHPPFFAFDSMTKDSESVDVYSSSNTITSRTFSIGSFNFSEVAKFNMTFHIDPTKTKPKGQIHEAFIRIEVECSFTSPFYPNPRHLIMEKPLKTAIKFYSQRDSCDSPLAMADDTLEASSYSTDGPPAQGKLNGQKAWVPVNGLKRNPNQFIGVKFTGLKTIHRIALQGAGDTSSAFVLSFRVFYSKDCVLWKEYKTKNNIKYLKGNTAAKKICIIPFDTPIEAKCVRINPTSCHKHISLRFELYGCASSSAAPVATLKSRTYLLDSTTNTIYACSIPMIRKNGISTCYYSSDSGTTWSAFHENVVNINMVNPATKKVYGLGLRNNPFSCTVDQAIKCAMIQSTDYDKIKVLTGVILAKEANKVSVTDDANSKIPVDPDFFTHNGKKVGASPLGIHWFDGSSWSRKTSWSFGE